MNKLFWQTAKVAPILFAASLLAPNGVNAQTVTAEKDAVNETLQQINNYQKQGQSNLSQVTNVNQLRDVSPTDWAYEALRSLVDRYGCISGFPNQTYRGNQPLSRYEFAAGLNSCLNQIERLIASQETIGVEELETIQRLTQEFEAELATIGGRVDEIESRTAVLEDSQFSTTTKLKGEAIFAVSDVFGDFADNDGDEDTSDEIEAETTFSSRVRLNFDTSFTGKDRLRTRLEGGNFEGIDDGLTGTDSTRLGFDTGGGFNIEVTDLHYRFPVGEKARVWVGALGLDLDDVFAVTNPMLESSGSGALSRFNRRNPLVFRGTESAGAGVNLDIIEDKVGLNLLYLTDDANDPTSSNDATGTPGEGLFAGSFSAGAQVEVSPFDSLELAATYVRNFQTAGSVNLSGSTVDGNATEPFTVAATGDEIDTAADKIGLGAKLDIGERIVVAGWGGFANVTGFVNGDDNDPSGEIWTWGANVSFLDLGIEGSKLSFRTF